MPKIVATREDWIKLGYELFANAGEKGLNVDRMSRQLRCNKSSFYWHFKTKADFLDRIIEYWVVEETRGIIEMVNAEGSPREKLLRLIGLAFRKDEQQDFIFYLKQYGRSRDRIATIVDQIDADRIEFVADILTGLGYSASQAMVKARIFYQYLIGYHELIKYKAQSVDYVSEVLMEINHFIKIDET